MMPIAARMQATKSATRTVLMAAVYTQKRLYGTASDNLHSVYSREEGFSFGIGGLRRRPEIWALRNCLLHKMLGCPKVKTIMP